MRVCATRVRVAAVPSSRRALVNILTTEPVALETWSARAAVRTVHVTACRVRVTTVRGIGTFVPVDASNTVPRPAMVACAHKTAGRVLARRVLVAVVALVLALVDVRAAQPVSTVPGVACARVAPDRVRTTRICRAMVPDLALVDVRARYTSARIPRLAAADKRAIRVTASRMLMAIVCVQLALIHI